MRTLTYRSLLTLVPYLALTLLFTVGCDDDQPQPARDEVTEPTPDQGEAQSDQDIVDPDLTLDEGVIDQMLPPPHLEAPRARVFLSDPVNDNGELTEVAMRQTLAPNGILTSESVQVFNCLNEDGGISGQISMGFTVEVSLCREVQVARPDPDGHYLSITPPEDFTDPNDQFAELMMYHHVNEIADYYQERHDFSRYDEPLPALVNVQLKTNPPLPFGGLQPGPDGFIPLDNALFFPKESWQAFAGQFGLPSRDTDLIVFFQGIADFAYDASVIYHEYTHAVIGINRLQGFMIDQYGVDASPGGMNEGLADYFAATALDSPSMGKYGIGSVNGGEGRDLDIAYRCPQDSHWEVHVHGRVIGSTMWKVRETVGAEIADRIMFDALELFNTNTTHQEASELLLVEAEEEGPEIAEQVRDILLSYGMLDCVRSRPWERYRASESRDRVPYAVPGTQSVGIPSLRAAGVPAYKQFYVTPPEESYAAVRLSWRVSASPTGFGAPADPEPLRLALSRGAPVELQLGPARYLDDQQLIPELNEGVQSVVLPISCMRDAEGAASPLHTLFINGSANELSLTEMDIEWLSDLPSGETLGTCERPEEPVAGEMAGEIAGETAGEIAGEIAGEMAGEMAGELAGEMAGELAGEVAGESAGAQAGATAGETP